MKEDLKELKSWARAQVEEQMRYMTRKMDEVEQDWCEARYAYKKTFNNGFPSIPSWSMEKDTEMMWRHIKEGKPYVWNISPEAVI